MTTRDHLLAYVKSHGYQPVKTRVLARFFDIREEEYHQFRSLIKEMVREGELVEGPGGRLMPSAPPKKLREGTFAGVLRLSAKGFGFIEPDDPSMKEDVFVPRGETLDAISGDRVVAQRVRRKFRREGQLPYTGRVIEILERGTTRFVGTYRVRGKTGTIKPDGGLLLIEDIPVADASASGAKPNDKVVFELLKYPAQNQEAAAVIVEVLGPRGAPGVDTLAVIRQFGLRDEFGEAPLAAARQAIERFTREEASRRTDLRGLLTVTVDPEGARDYDDAVSIEQVGNGVTRLGVHIADVSFFVRPGDALDREAYVRATSVYLPTVVLPMLPELLSNGICSLQEGQDRLVQSVFMDLDGAARVQGVKFVRGVIRNRKRLTYGQVNQVLDEGRQDIVEGEVLRLLNDMNALARRILARRRRQEYLELDLPEVDLVFDEEGRVVDAHPEDQSFSHKIIEMFMVEANEAVARHLAKERVSFMRRIHEAPSAEKLEKMARFVRSCGLELGDPGDRTALQRLLKTTRNTAASYPIHVAVLRSMMQAQYAIEPEGHWALGSKCYCHFTSPIRRYPDLTVHRSLAQVEGWDGEATGARESHGGRRGARGPGAAAVLRQAAAHCSEAERRAEAAERELTKVKILTLLEQHVGEEFAGVVSAVEQYGLFVEIHKYLIEGLVHVHDLRDDAYEFDRRSFSLTGQRFKRRIRVGDSIRVTIAAVDIPRRELDLVPAPGTPFAAGAAAPRAGREVKVRAAGAKQRPAPRRPRGKHRRKGRGRR